MDTPAQCRIQETHLKQNDKESSKIRHVENYTRQMYANRKQEWQDQNQIRTIQDPGH